MIEKAVIFIWLQVFIHGLSPGNWYYIAKIRYFAVYYNWKYLIYYSPFTYLTCEFRDRISGKQAHDALRRVRRPTPAGV